MQEREEILVPPDGDAVLKRPEAFEYPLVEDDRRCQSRIAPEAPVGPRDVLGERRSSTSSMPTTPKPWFTR
jgi:hypothetical protein